MVTAHFLHAWRQGHALSLEQMIAEAVALTAKAESIITSVQPYPAGLTAREIEVLRLIADGLSNHEIAGRLIITVSTVKWHLNNLFGKLAVHSRTQALAQRPQLARRLERVRLGEDEVDLGAACLG